MHCESQSIKVYGGIFLYEISATIIETPILFNIIKSMHDTVTKNSVYTYVFKIND